MNSTTTAHTGTDRALSALQAIPGTDIASTLARIAQALEKQNELLGNLTHVVRGVPQAIEAVGEYL